MSSAKAKAKLEQMEHRQSFRNLWHSDLMSTIQADSPYCIFATLCSPCASYLLRKRALYDDMSRYTCCAGYMPCSGKCGEKKCPEFCLFTEVFCCFTNSVASTRWLLQDEFSIQTTKCDNCIIGCMFCIQQLACIFSILALLTDIDGVDEASELLNCMANLVYCMVCACMQTQHKIEMDKRDGKFGPPRVMGVPPMQQMSRMDQDVPPPVGYPGPVAYGQASYDQQPYGQAAYGQPYGQAPYGQPYGHAPPPQAQGYYPPPPPANPAGYPPSSPPPPPPPPPGSNPNPPKK